MRDVLSIVAPVFGLIALGIAIGQANYLSEGAGKILAEFGFKVAMPALLFNAAISVAPLPVSPAALIVAYFAASTLVWIAATVAGTLVLRRPAPEGPALAMASCFGNTVMLGIPVAVTAFGADAAVPAAILVSIETPLLWICAAMHAEWTSRRASGLRLRALAGIARELATNPIVMSLVLGTLFRLCGLTLPAGPARLIEILGQAAVPTALVALGLTLSTFRIRGEATALVLISALKLLLFPALVLVTTTLLSVPKVWAAVAVLFAAMPTGANAYLFAVRTERLVNAVSGAIVLTTLIAALTVSLLLLHLDPASRG